MQNNLAGQHNLAECSNVKVKLDVNMITKFAIEYYFVPVTGHTSCTSENKMGMISSLAIRKWR